ncbi:MAG: nuclear transport factor 2 family protein [Acidipila sp.]|nr:nuclear transport factor 2 family protein [Acidipila sp.]
MKKFSIVLSVGLLILAAAGAQGPAESATAREVTGMLRQFLIDAARNDRAGFEKFFADDVIYTRAVGVVISKADILKSLDTDKPPADSKTTYSAEDVTVHEYGDTAVVAFRLLAVTAQNESKVGMANTESESYRNTGTFLRRNGKWQVVAWQATKITESGATE